MAPNRPRDNEVGDYGPVSHGGRDDAGNHACAVAVYCVGTRLATRYQLPPSRRGRWVRLIDDKR